MLCGARASVTDNFLEKVLALVKGFAIDCNRPARPSLRVQRTSSTLFFIQSLLRKAVPRPFTYGL